MAPKLKIALIAMLALAFCFALAAGTLAEKAEKSQKLTIDQLPAAVRATLESQAQGAKIEEIEKEDEAGAVVYSADVVKGAEKLEVKIAEDGKLLESKAEEKKCEGKKCEENDENEAKVTLDQVPPAVQATLKQIAGAGKIDEIEKKTEAGVEIYSADITKDGKSIDAKVAADGKLIKSEIEDKTEESNKEESGDNENEKD